MAERIGIISEENLFANRTFVNVIAFCGAGRLNSTVGLALGVAGSGDFCIGGVVAYRAVLICIPTDFGAGGILSCYLSQSVTKSVNGNGHAAEFFAANGAVNNFVIRTVVYAIGIYFVFNNGCASGVAEFGNYGLRNSSKTAIAAMLACGQTSCGAGRFYSCIINYIYVIIGINCNRLRLCNDLLADCAEQLASLALGNAGCGNLFLYSNGNVQEIVRGNYLLSKKDFIANAAVPTFGQAGRDAGRSYIRIDYYGVTMSVNGNGGAAEFFTAYGAVNNFVIRTVVYAIGSYFVFLNCCARGVAKCRNYLLSNESHTATIAVRAVGQTFLGAGCSLTEIDDFFVAKCRAVFNNDLVIATNLTNVLSLCRIGAICRNFDHFVIVLCGDINLFAREFFTANRAVYYFKVETVYGRINTANGISACFFYCFSGRVTKCRNYVLRNKDLFAYVAVRAFGQTGRGAGGIYCRINYYSVTGCSYHVIGVGVAAHSAGISGVAVRGAVRIGYNANIIMSECRDNNGLRLVAMPLVVLALRDGVTILIAGGILVVNFFEIVIQFFTGNYGVIQMTKIANVHIVRMGYTCSRNRTDIITGSTVSAVMLALLDLNIVLIVNVTVCTDVKTRAGSKHDYRQRGKDKCAYQKNCKKSFHDILPF